MRAFVRIILICIDPPTRKLVDPHENQRMDRLANLMRAQRERLAHAELRLKFLGELRRTDLMSRFGVQSATATRDIALYQRKAPYNLEYQASSKSYLYGGDRFMALFDFSASQVLAWLTRGGNDGEARSDAGPMAWGDPEVRDGINLDVLSVLTRAIRGGGVVEVSYESAISDATTREIVPFALAQGGRNWHVRAFDRATGAFKDFVLAWCVEARSIGGTLSDHEKPMHDTQWQRMLSLELVVHPVNVQCPAAIERQYGMVGGLLTITVRAAMARHLLERMGVDCSVDHVQRECMLWLRNGHGLRIVGNGDIPTTVTVQDV